MQPSDNKDLQLSPTGSDQPSETKEESGVTFSWGIIMVRTKKLLSILDYLARTRLFTDLGWIFLGITIAAAAVMIWLMLDQNYLVLTGSLAFRCAVGAATAAQCQQIGVAVTHPPPLQTYLLLPGLNPVIPIVYGIIGIVVAVVIHEGTHGVIARRLKMPVKSTGLLFLLIIPIGAFVEIDEKEIQKSRFRDSGRVMAGGPGSNIIVALVALAILLVIVGGLVPAQFNGVQVQQIVTPTSSQPSPAYTLYQQHHLQAGDVIVAVNGTAIHSLENLTNYLNNTRANESLVLSIDHSGKVSNYSIVLAPYPSSIENTTKGFIGISESFDDTTLNNIKNTYSSSFFKNPVLYLVVPGIFSQANTVVPFSNELAKLYSSPSLGAVWYPLAMTTFWIWFINVNLAFFNAIPLYPLDGGQALMNFFSHFGRKGVEMRAKMLTTIVSLIMLALILSFLFLPRILGVVSL
ncbi:MAG: site-2 protease family protein [Nitrososphaerota archaeon]|nr:site-2 protease family protein [Nitrososphaerota archaeon]